MLTLLIWTLIVIVILGAMNIALEWVLFDSIIFGVGFLSIVLQIEVLGEFYKEYSTHWQWVLMFIGLIASYILIVISGFRLAAEIHVSLTLRRNR